MPFTDCRINDVFGLISEHVAETKVRDDMYRITRAVLAAREDLGLAENSLMALLDRRADIITQGRDGTARRGAGAAFLFSTFSLEDIDDYLSRLEEIVFTEDDADYDVPPSSSSCPTSSSDVTPKGTTSSPSDGVSSTSASEGTGDTESTAESTSSTVAAAADLISHFHDDLIRLWGNMRRANMRSNTALFLSAVAVGSCIAMFVREGGEPDRRMA